MGLANRVQEVNRSIENACKRSGRKVEDVKLIAVSKTFPLEAIKEAYDTGLRIFGENKAQELRDKAPQMPNDVEWHFIGHLQSNKIKYVASESSLIHSVDSLALAESISTFCGKKGLTVSILIEVNTSGEDSKFGLKPQEVAAVFKQMRILPNIDVQGLMTIGPLTKDKDKIRASFRQLRLIREELATVATQSEMATLSMGMSQDYEIAIEEGSTMIRVGTAIFGRREYKI
jgi:pyridoxal phosphate enzyme (YggS family)